MTPPEGYDKIVCCINSFAGDQSEAAISIAARAELAALCARLEEAEEGMTTAYMVGYEKGRDELEAEVKTWKANHDEMKARNKLLRNRPDLPMERVVGYDDMMRRLEEAEARVEVLEVIRKKVCELISDAGDYQTSMRTNAVVCRVIYNELCDLIDVEVPHD